MTSVASRRACRSGFFFGPDGWNGSGVDDKSNTRYIVEELNGFVSKRYRKHAVLLANEVREFLVLRFEDVNRPSGDNDINDLVVDYSFTEVPKATNTLKDIRLDLRVRAMGGSQNHGFALQLPVPPAVVEAVVGQALTENYIQVGANGTETGMQTAVIPIFTSGYWRFLGGRAGGDSQHRPGTPPPGGGRADGDDHPARRRAPRGGGLPHDLAR